MEEKKNKENKLTLSVNLDTTPIVYTDNIIITVNPFGVVLDITQRLGPTDQVRITSRIGMSKEHAKKFVEELGNTIILSEGSSQSGKGTT